MPTVGFADDVARSVREGDGAYVGRLVLSEASSEIVTVTVTAGDEYNGRDLIEQQQTVVFQPGQTTAEVRFGVIDDDVHELLESAYLNIGFAHNAQIDGASQGLYIDIEDNEPATDLTVRFAGPTGLYGIRVSEDAGFYERAVVLSRASSEVVTVTVGTYYGGPGYDSMTRTLTFQPGETSQTFRFAISDDRTDGPDRPFEYHIEGATNADIGTAYGVAQLSGYVVDNDLPTGPTVRFAAVPANPIVVDETAGTARITLELTRASSRVVTAVVESFAYDSQTTGMASRTVTFQPGQTSVGFDVAVRDNAVADYSAGIVLRLGAITNATPDYSSGVASALDLRIRDDDTVSVQRFGDGNDAIVASLGNNDLYGGGGDDRLFSRGYDNHLFGGDGTDTAIYLRPAKAFDVVTDGGNGYVHGRNLFGADGNYVIQKHDTLASIERLEFADGTLSFDAGSAIAQVDRLYDTMLGRDPDFYGAQGWTQALRSGASLLAVADAIAASPEFGQRTAGLDHAGIVDYAYLTGLGRAPDPGGKAGWTAYLDAGHSVGELMVAISESAEHLQRTADAVEAGLWTARQSYLDVEFMYLAVFGRLPDAGGLTGWAQALEGGLSLHDLAANFVASAEYRNGIAQLGNGGIVDSLYANALHRAADPGGRAAYTGYLDNGGSLVDVVLAFEGSHEFRDLSLVHVLNGVDFLGGDFPVI